MDSTRQNKINRLIQKEMGDLFQKQTKSMPGTLVSVSSVRVTPDLGLARIYLSIFPSNKTDELLKATQQNTKSVRYDLGQRVRSQLRKIPDLEFHIDDSLDYIEHIDELLKK
ncbi:MAG: 30S ribosome-binding factor RbfA [Bacteroidaceae bacterium]